MKSPTRSPSELAFGSLLAYAPRGISEQSVRSQQVARHIKNCRAPYIQRVGLRFAEQVASGNFAEFLGPGVVLVPAPRSSPTRTETKGALWPAQRICAELEAHGLCAAVEQLLERHTPVTKSALARRGADRPSPDEHLASLHCADLLRTQPDRITIVDDVVTRGSTLLGCAWALASKLPQADIRALAVVRTISPGEVDDILAPVETGRIYLYSGSPRRDP